MDILEKLFGSGAKVKIIRLFLFNPSADFDLESITNRARISPQAARTNMKVLQDIKLVRSRSFIKAVKKKYNGRVRTEKKRVKGWALNENFSYLAPLQSFLIHVSPLQDQAIVRKFNKVGKVKLLIIAGVFTQEKDSRVDILVVGDSLRKSTIQTVVKDIEAELGKELTYSVFDTKDFQYRLGMYDKLVRDILDYPHKKLVNKLEL